jgi:hypothetical protein
MKQEKKNKKLKHRHQLCSLQNNGRFGSRTAHDSPANHRTNEFLGTEAVLAAGGTFAREIIDRRCARDIIGARFGSERSDLKNPVFRGLLAAFASSACLKSQQIGYLL